MRTIYTTEDIKINGVEVLGIEKLPRNTYRWIMQRRRTLLRSATLPERIATKMFYAFHDRPVRQAYFLIRKRSYFLDFFFPERMVAVEIDGSVHKLRKEHDRRRDADFRSIGIRTVRISNKDVMQGRLYDVLMKKLYK